MKSRSEKNQEEEDEVKVEKNRKTRQINMKVQQPGR